MFGGLCNILVVVSVCLVFYCIFGEVIWLIVMIEFSIIVYVFLMRSE